MTVSYCKFSKFLMKDIQNILVFYPAFDAKKDKLR